MKSRHLSRIIIVFCVVAKAAVVGFCTQSPPRRARRVTTLRDTSLASSDSTIPSDDSYSTLTLLEHVHLLSPGLHESVFSDGTAVDFFVDQLGFGLDVKSSDNIQKRDGVVFVDCGACQLHLNDEEPYCGMMRQLREEQAGCVLDNPFEIGLRYATLSKLKRRLSRLSKEKTYEGGHGADGREFLWIEDSHGRLFVAREAPAGGGASVEELPSVSSLCQQNIVRSDSKDCSSELVERYGADESECLGIDYIEFFVPVVDADGTTAEKIAKFYQTFFDAPASVVNDGTSNLAVVAFGKVDDNGRSEQSLLFREVEVEDAIMKGTASNDDLGTGHHISIYVGSCEDDFEVAASNCVEGGLLWVNRQFKDVVLTVEEALEEKQFRFKDIVDIETGDVLYTLEHEIRSVTHPLFPGLRR